MDLSIIIINYNTFELTKQTIRSIICADLNFNYEIILVDNKSKDDSLEKLKATFKTLIDNKTIKIIANENNLGFSKANNIGIKQSTGDYILLLNSDTIIKQDISGDNTLKSCLDYIKKDNNIGALGCRVLLENGDLDHACKRGFPTPKASLYYFLGLDKKNPEKYGQYDALHLKETEIGEVDALIGAFMLIPRKVFEEVGLLSEDFFMFGEDIDLCYRIKESGYKIVYYGHAIITHLKGQSSKKQRSKVIFDFHNAMWIFYKKHYFKKYNFLVSSLVYLGIWSRYIISIIKNLF